MSVPQLAADMELFRQLPGGVQRQASRCARDALLRVRTHSVCRRCGSWTTHCSSATPRLVCSLMQRRLQRCCVNWTWCAHARALAQSYMCRHLTRLGRWHAELCLGCHPWAGWRCWSCPRMHRQAWRRCREAVACAIAQGAAQRQRQRPAPCPTGACAVCQPCVAMLMHSLHATTKGGRLRASVHMRRAHLPTALCFEWSCCHMHASQPAAHGPARRLYSWKRRGFCV